VIRCIGQSRGSGRGLFLRRQARTRHHQTRVAKTHFSVILVFVRFNEGIDAAKEALQMVEKAGGFRKAAQRRPGLALKRRLR